MISQNLEQSSFKNQIDEFIRTQVISRGLDERTAKAYRIDLENFYLWLECVKDSTEELPKQKYEKYGQVSAVYFLSGDNLLSSVSRNQMGYEEWMEEYLNYLVEEKRLRLSTISRKQRVFRYYLSYLVSQGIVKEYRSLNVTNYLNQLGDRENKDDVYLTKKEIDAFFKAIQQEYEELDSDFRKRVCLRDQIMMGLLFYHRIEISELLRIEISDYNRKTSTLIIHRKKEKDRNIYLFSRALQKQMEQWLDEHEYFEHEGRYCNRLFLSKLGKPISMKMVINIFEKYRKKAGIIKECTPKDLKNGLGRYAEELMIEREERSAAD